jgi:8-oxo-dGTP pyrophosphatase MutT (NUDIX family)
MDRSCPQVDTGSVTAVVERRMRIAAYVICRDDRERFLLTRLVTADGAPRWTLPGGGLDPGEHPEDGALRELTERRASPARSMRCSTSTPCTFRTARWTCTRSGWSTGPG